MICVLDHGAVAGLGTHDELYAACPLYREICLSQLRREELEGAPAADGGPAGDARPASGDTSAPVLHGNAPEKEGC